jgi:TRAP-type mannitol/chloroaromatic compound transport system substrate-binding protein
MSDNLIELPKLIEEKIISYRKYYILENINPHDIYFDEYIERNVGIDAIYDEKHLDKLVNYITNIFKEAFKENKINSTLIQYLTYGECSNYYQDVQDVYPHDMFDIEEKVIMDSCKNFKNIRIQGFLSRDNDDEEVNDLQISFRIQEISMNINSISLKKTKEQLENTVKREERFRSFFD